MSGSTPAIDNMLLLGVYFGRDLMMIADIARKRSAPLCVTGVDKFTDEYCDDWPEAKRGMSWEAAGFGSSPSLQRTRETAGRFCDGITVKLVAARAEEFLGGCPEERYGWIYIDTSHDYESTKRLIELALQVLRPPAILSGDDYSNEGTWGVKSAVRDSLGACLVWGGRIWYTQIR